MANNDLVKALGATAQAMGQNPPPEALMLMAEDLDDYSEHDIANALKSLRRKGGRFCIASILDYITALDGRLTPDAAWALMPKSESDSAVITQDMADAWGVAYEQYYSGDEVGAQIAFKREYQSIVERARNAGTKPNWFPSLGHDQSSRADALIEGAVNLRIGVEHAEHLLGGDNNNIRRLYESASRANVLTESQAAKAISMTNDDKKAGIYLPQIKKIPNAND